jgi:hypothetical protein
MSRGVLLDPATGRPVSRAPVAGPVRTPVGADARSVLLERMRLDGRFKRVVHFLDRAAEDVHLPGREPVTAADGLYYRDTRAPFMVADQTAITGTSEALLWPAYFTSLVASYFTVGKMVRLTAWGKLTTAGASPGTVTFTVRYGTTTGGTSLGASAASPTFAVSQTNITWGLVVDVVCRATGSGTSGSLLAFGQWFTTPATFATTAGLVAGLCIPASAPAAAGVDTTSAQGIIVDATLGSASDSMTCMYLAFEALN